MVQEMFRDIVKKFVILAPLYCVQGGAQIHQHLFKIKIQNTVWGNVFKYKYSILYF